MGARRYSIHATAKDVVLTREGIKVSRKSSLASSRGQTAH